MVIFFWIYFACPLVIIKFCLIFYIIYFECTPGIITILTPILIIFHLLRQRNTGNTPTSPPWPKIKKKSRSRSKWRKNNTSKKTSFPPPNWSLTPKKPIKRKSKTSKMMNTRKTCKMYSPIYSGTEGVDQKGCTPEQSPQFLLHHFQNLPQESVQWQV